MQFAGKDIAPFVKFRISNFLFLMHHCNVVGMFHRLFFEHTGEGIVVGGKL